MTLRLAGSTSGYAEIDAPAVAGNNTLLLPTGNGTTDQVLGGGGTGQLAWVDRGRMTLETKKSATGSTVDFTSVPSWAKKITVLFMDVSTNAATQNAILVQLGTASQVETTGYAGSYGYVGGTPTAFGSTNGFGIYNDTASDIVYGLLTIVRSEATSNYWSASGVLAWGTRTYTLQTAGAKLLSTGALTTVRLTLANTANAFDAGNFNLLYEG